MSIEKSNGATLDFQRRAHLGLKTKDGGGQLLRLLLLLLLLGEGPKWIPRIHCYKETYNQEHRDQLPSTRQGSRAWSLCGAGTTTVYTTFWAAENHAGAPLCQARNGASLFWAAHSTRAHTWHGCPTRV